MQQIYQVMMKSSVIVGGYLILSFGLLVISGSEVNSNLQKSKFQQYSDEGDLLPNSSGRTDRSLSADSDGSKTGTFDDDSTSTDDAFSYADRVLLEALPNVIGSLEGSGCRRDLNLTLDAVRRRELWGMAMFDSSVKSTVGIEHGNVFQLGHFDQCMGINGLQQASIIAQFCLATVRIDGYQQRTLVSRKEPHPRNYSQVHWGLCVPASCSETDVAALLSKTTGLRSVSIPAKGCHRDRATVTSINDVIFLSVIFFFVLMVVLSTLYHLQSMYSCRATKENVYDQVFKSFSIVENLRKLGQDSKDDYGLGCINGIKALSMVFILGGHALLFIVGGALYNPGFYGEQVKLLRNAILLNSPLLVDTFLLLSGFLFARLLLIELDKRRGKVNFVLIYIFRYIRLTPAYAAMIALYATWLPRLGSGPLWDRRMALEQSRCQASWWRNILYINNYIGTDQLCMFQSWYLATDTQLFVLAPLLLYPMWTLRRRTGLTLVSAVGLISVVIPFCVTYYGQLDPSLMYFIDELDDIQGNPYFANVYVKTHMRATAYIFGILAGYLVHLMQETNFTIGRRTVAFLWIVSTIVGSASMFGVSLFYNSFGTENYLYNALYAALHRLGWSLSNGWLVLACVTGHAGPLKRLLSARVLIPLSRLTYCAYLTNGLVELYISASQRVPLYSSIVGLTAVTLSHVFLTFLAALGLCLMFESPIHGIEKIFLRRQRQPQQQQQHRSEKTTDACSRSTNDTHSTSDDSIA
ncbi:nose resistant to fluoxetine protein 6-like [Malaya genurostris]|uniref:nose resistant to fluoxetine protein 6-like n=1 Tax=Malaya genurostris TaxID=325434 RepID=UPI0026F3FA5B|nr:nose resistant to fluoxetine protein 6-like [Malaya genurostris]